MQSKESLQYIDNSVAYLNASDTGTHATLFLYKGRELTDVPHLEIRCKGPVGSYRVEVLKNSQWIPLTTLVVSGNSWIHEKVELGDAVSAFTGYDGKVRIRFSSRNTTGTLEVDYIAITSDQVSSGSADLARVF